MKEYNLRVDNSPNMKFTGERIASASSSPETSRSDYSGTTGRWTELDLYKTKGGKYICHQVGFTQWQGEHARYSGAVCETEDSVTAFFGHGWLAKELYENADLDAAVTID